MSNKSLIFYLIYFFLSFEFISANEIQFEAREILSSENGDIITGNKDGKVVINKNIKIFADKYTYYKKKKLITIEKNVEVVDSLNELKINTQLIHYVIDKQEIVSFGKTKTVIKNKYLIDAKDIYYNHATRTIYSKKSSNLYDNFENEIKSNEFKYFLDEELYKATDIELIDNVENKYFVSSGMVKLDEYNILGKDIEILLKNNNYDNPLNEPRLKGNSVSYKNNLTIIKKGIFTSCKITGNCPPWSITSEEITHDKTKKEVQYKNAWLKLYDKPIMYFPKFFHPDPTVERKSGFLTPTFGSSKNLGASINIPYFHAINNQSDLTFKPRIFSDDKFLIQNEYRLLSKNTSNIVDFSIYNDKDVDKNGRKIHFFSNSKIDLDLPNFDESDLFIKLERTSNDNYLKSYSLENDDSIVNNTGVLESIIEYNASKDNLDLSLSLETYENQSLPNSDRYEFVYPNYFISNTIYNNNNIVNNYTFSSSGNQKKFLTNKHEAVQINDFIATSNDFINNFGFTSNFEFLLKNVNSVGKNSKKFKDDEQSEILSVGKYDLSLPLNKLETNYSNFLTPKVSLRFSPNSTKNNKDEERFLNTNNVFSSNRIGFNDSVEGGTSLTIGLNFQRKSNEKNRYLSSNIATVFREEENDNLPQTSTLGKKQSDFIGDINISTSKYLSFNYDYSIDNDLNQFNLHRFKNTINVNNFVNEFIFYEENNLIGKKSFFENTTSYDVDENNKFSFKTRTNKETNIDEFYNLIYQYQTDCLIASISYNKEYYSSSSLRPGEELFFNITLIPLGSTKTDNIMD